MRAGIQQVRLYMAQVSEKTPVPLGLAIIAIGGGAFWMATLNQNSLANSTRLDKVEMKQDAVSEQVQKIRESLVRIEGKLGINKD